MSDARIERGEKSRDFTLEDTRGNQVSLSDFEGEKVVYVVFNRGFF